MATNFFNWKLTIWQIIVVILLAVIAWLAMCRKPVSNPTEKPILKQPKEIIKEVRKDSVEAKHISDSVKTSFNRIDLLVDKLKNENNGLKKDMEIQSQIISDLLEQRVPNDYEETLITKYNKLVTDLTKNDSNCNTIVSLKDIQLGLNKFQISQQDSLYKKLRGSLDSSLAAQTATNKENEKIKPRNKLAIGLVGNFYPSAGIAGGLTFIHKKGWLFETNVLRMNNDWYYQGGIKKIIKIRN